MYPSTHQDKLAYFLLCEIIIVHLCLC